MPVRRYGEFAGKLAFASTGGSATNYLTTRTFPSGGRTILMPVMSATTVGDKERCLFYQASGGGLYIQLGDLSWVTLNADLGWLCSSERFEDATPVFLSGGPIGQTLEIQTPNGRTKVWYTVDNPSPLLTVNEASGALCTFAPLAITPSLAELRRSGGQGADLVDANLNGAVLNGIDLTEANLSGAGLAQASCVATIFKRAKLKKAVLTDIRLDQAVLDNADLTGADLRATRWGRPASAQGIVLADCKAVGAVLGQADKPLNCRRAVLTGGDFRGADLS
jgi:hypothetical protein